MDGLLEVGDGRWTTGTTCTSSSWGSSRISSGTRSGWRRPGEAGSSRGKRLVRQSTPFAEELIENWVAMVVEEPRH